MIKYLEENGTKIQAYVQKVKQDDTLTLNGESPYIIVSHWVNPETSELHIFKSDYIWFNPSDFIKNDKINVIIDRKKPKRYSVDLSFFPTVAR